MLIPIGGRTKSGDLTDRIDAVRTDPNSRRAAQVSQIDETSPLGPGESRFRSVFAGGSSDLAGEIRRSEEGILCAGRGA